MALKTVRVPVELEGPFAAAEAVVSRYFAERRSDPEHGTLEIFGERYVLVRAASLSVEFFSLVGDLYGPGREAEADEFARNILFDLAHAVGKSDAHAFHAKMGVSDPIERLSAGPIHFAHAGWAFVDISAESRPSAGEDFYLLYDHPYSFESDAWVRSGRRREDPACIMNAGYSSGWCEASFGIELVAAEVLCRARGDEHCRFIMAHPARIEDHVERWRKRSSRPAPGGQSIPDFFARKRMEEELRRAQSDLERRVEERTGELSRSNEQLTRAIEERERAEKKLLQAQKLEAIGRLAGGIAHDFNNLMAIVAVNCEILRRRLPDGEALRLLVDEIASAGGRASGLTQQLLAFARAQPRRSELVDLNRVVLDLGRMLERVIGEDVTLATRLGPRLGAVEGDRGQLEQVVMNLAVNARDAMPQGGTLTIETEPVLLDEPRAAELGATPGASVRLTVSDTGTGMDEATQAQIFDPFFTTKESGKGTGLGLSTVYGIVKQSGGTIAVESAPGAGTRFHIYFPAAAGFAAPRPSAHPPVFAPGGTETILLVEDQERLRDAVRVVLSEFGYDVLAARDPEDALGIAAGHPTPIHVLLTDVVMPRMSGPELAQRIRELRPATRVLFMSGYADAALIRLLPGDALLPKPFHPDELARKLREVLGEGEGE